MQIIAAERPRVVAAYLAIRSECDPAAVVTGVHARSIDVALPAIGAGKVMSFCRYRPGDRLVDGGFGTLAPGPEQPALDPDLVIVPLVAFDRTGSRLGHGLGFYDRAIAALNQRGIRPGLIGIGFAVQEVAAIPAEPHDARLDWIVTEDETLDLRRQE